MLLASFGRGSLLLSLTLCSGETLAWQRHEMLVKMQIPGFSHPQNYNLYSGTRGSDFQPTPG